MALNSQILLERQFRLDPTLYDLKDDEKTFFKTCTRIQDDDELQKHICDVQAEAYAVQPYPCIRRFTFTSLKISSNPAYRDVLKIGRERPGAILLDLGCCFGTDTRKVIADGFPQENVVATDLRAEFWTLGHKLFKTSEETFSVAFLPGDILEPAFLSPNGSSAHTSSTSSAPLSPARTPSLSTLTSLNPLHHQISVIHAFFFFHLFSESDQNQVAQLLGMLLSPLPGSVILGSHRGLPDSEENAQGRTLVQNGLVEMFVHSPTSWATMWVGKGGVFQPGGVALSTRAIEVGRKDMAHVYGDPTYKAHLLTWSITRLEK